MPYTIGIPTATQFISASQPLIQQNFTELQTWASIDHSPLASAPGTLEGFHYKTTFVPQGPPLTAAIPTFPVGYPGIYAAPPANVNGNPSRQPLTARNELWMTNALGNIFSLTGALSALNAGGTPDGWFYLPSGILIKYNTIQSAPATPTQTYLFSTAANTPIFAIAPTVLACTGTTTYPAVGGQNNTVSIDGPPTALQFQYSLVDENDHNIQGYIMFIAIGA